MGCSHAVGGLLEGKVLELVELGCDVCLQVILAWLDDLYTLSVPLDVRHLASSTLFEDLDTLALVLDYQK